LRVLGIDDSPFQFGDKRALVVGVVMRLPSYLEGVMRTECQVDGTDANVVLDRMIMRSRYRDQLRLVMIDGVALGGFNVVDISLLNRRTGIPFVTVTRDPPDMLAMKEALRDHFDDWESRMSVIMKNPLREVPTDHKPIYVSEVGIDPEMTDELIRGCTVRGALPEPIRIAHLIATAMVMGESRGRA